MMRVWRDLYRFLMVAVPWIVLLVGDDCPTLM